MQRLIYLCFICLIFSGVYAGALEAGHDAFDAKHYTRAYELWLPLAEADDADAQYNLGLLYRAGFGVKKNPRQALIWFTRAAQQGLADAQYNAGIMHYLGEGVYPNHKTAVEWWQLAAAKGHSNAQYNLAAMYAYANGGLRLDMDKAVALWEQAAQQGHTEAIDTLIRLYSNGMKTQFAADPQKAAYWQSIKDKYFK